MSRADLSQGLRKRIAKDKTFPATHIVHWPSGPVTACEHHARTLIGLGRFMGSHVIATEAPEGSECSNCKNEASAK